MNFHPPFSEPLFNHADAQTSNTSTRLWFYYIITKIHPPFQNPGSAPDIASNFKNWENVTRSRGVLAGTPYDVLDKEAPPERGTFFRLQVYERVRKISQFGL